MLHIAYWKEVWYTKYTMCNNFLWRIIMDDKNRVAALRESTGLSRKDFCNLVQIPYRTMTEWELGNRHAPEYVLRLLEYYLRSQGLIEKTQSEVGNCSEKETD